MNIIVNNINERNFKNKLQMHFLTKSMINFKKPNFFDFDLNYDYQNKFSELFNKEEKQIIYDFFDDNEKYTDFIEKVVNLEKFNRRIENKYKNKIDNLNENLNVLKNENKNLVNQNKEIKKKYDKILNEKKEIKNENDNLKYILNQKEFEIREKSQKIKILITQIKEKNNRIIEATIDEENED